MSNIIDQINTETLAELNNKRPDFNAGDTVRVHVKVKEGSKERIQVFEGVVIARKNDGINSNFTVRKILFGEGVERMFPLYAPVVADIEVVRRGDVRRAKLYYLRGRTGKAARIAEKARSAKSKEVEAAAEETPVVAAEAETKKPEAVAASA